MKLSRKYCILALFLVMSALIGAAWAVDSNIKWTDNNTKAELSGDYQWKDKTDGTYSPVLIDLKGHKLTINNGTRIYGNGLTVTSTSGDSEIFSSDFYAYLYGASRLENVKLVSPIDAQFFLYAIGAKKDAAKDTSTDIVIKNVQMAAPTNGKWRIRQFKVAGGGVNISNDLSSATVTIENATVGHSIYGGTDILTDGTSSASVGKTLINLNNGAVVVRAVYGGGESRARAGTATSTVGASHIIVNEGASIPGTFDIEDKPTEKGCVYGGGNAEEDNANGRAGCHVKEALIEIKGGEVAHVYGGGRAEANAGYSAVSSVDKTEIMLIGDAGLKAVSVDVKAGGASVGDGSAYVGSAIIKLSGLTSAAAPKEGLVIDGSGTENGTTLVFENVKADLSLAAITSMDAVQIDSDSKATVKNIGGAKKIVVTGDFNKMAAADILTLNEAVSPDDVTVDISGAVNVAKYEWDGEKLMVMGTSSGTAEPTTPKLPADIPAGVEPAEAEIAVVAADADEAVKAAALEEVSAGLKDIASSDLAIGASGAVTAKAETVKNAAASLVAAGETISTVSPLPVFGAEVTAGNTAAVAYKIKGADLLAASAADVKVVKYLGGGKAELFKYAAAAADFADTCFTVMLHDTDTIAGSIEDDTEYDLVLFVKDGGSFDLDEEDGWVADPAALIKTEKKSSGGSSSGCNGGYGALMILAAALLPLAYRRNT